jgi:hypothetical protein
MSAGAIIFMLGTWSIVLGLTIFCFYRILSGGKK